MEYFYRDMDVKAFDDVVADPVKPGDDGTIEIPDRPGHGVPLDEDALEEFRDRWEASRIGWQLTTRTER